MEILNRWTKALLYSSAADLRNANLSEADLRNANLSAADLSAADLRNANLSEADLRGSECLHAQGDFIRLAGTRHAVIATDENNVSIGCIRNTLAWWREHFDTAGRKENYTAAQIEEYRLHIEYVATWLANLSASREAK